MCQGFFGGILENRLEVDSLKLKDRPVFFAVELNCLHKQTDRQKHTQKTEINLISMEWRAWLQTPAASHNTQCFKKQPSQLSK